MSIKVIAHILDRVYDSASQKLMMIAIGDRADDEGVCFNGVEYLMKKHNGISRRTAERLLKSLEESGDLVIVLGDGIETKHGKTNRYYVKSWRDEQGLPTPKPGTRAEQLEQATNWVHPTKTSGVADPTETTGQDPTTTSGVHPTETTGQDPTTTSGNPLVEPSGDSSDYPKKDFIDPATNLSLENKFSRTTALLRRFFDKKCEFLKSITGEMPPLSWHSFKGTAYNDMMKIAELELIITPDELAGCLDDIVAGSQWYRKNNSYPSLNKVAGAIVLHVQKSRDIVVQNDDQTIDENSNWSQFAD